MWCDGCAMLTDVAFPGCTWCNNLTSGCDVLRGSGALDFRWLLAQKCKLCCRNTSSTKKTAYVRDGRQLSLSNTVIEWKEGNYVNR